MRRLLMLLALLPVIPTAQAEQKELLGEHVVHYSAQNSNELSPEVARQYGLSRSPRLALLMITVQDAAGNAVAASVSGEAKNLLGQSEVLDLREVREASSIYYLGLVSISNRETKTFSLQVQPEGSSQSYPLRFSQQFFTD